MDHHGVGKRDPTSGTKMMSEIMEKAEMLEDKPKWLRRVITFVNDIDNLSYLKKKDEKDRKIFNENYLRNEWPNSLYALAEKQIPFETLIELCKSGIIKDPSSPFTKEELAGSLGGFKIGDSTIKELGEKQKKEVEKAFDAIKGVIIQNKKDGLNLDTESLGKIIYHNYKKNGIGKINIVPDHLAFKLTRAKNFDTYMSWNKKKDIFYINSTDQNLSKIVEELNKVDRGCALDVRGTMVFGKIKNLTEEQFLNIIDPKILSSVKPELIKKDVNTKEKSDNIEEKSEKETRDDIELASLEAEFLALSGKFKMEKEAYNKDVDEVKKEIEKLKNEILELEKEENNNITEEALNNIVENLSSEDKKILVEEMESNKPLSFESDEVKTDAKVFLQNEMVKNLSGIKVSEKVKSIIKKSAKYVLAIGVMATLWSGKSKEDFSNTKDFDNKNNTTEITKNTITEKKVSISKPFIKVEKSNEYMVLPENVGQIHSYARENIKDSYIVIDKPSATLYVFNEKNEVIATMPVLLGRTKGEEKNTVNLDDEKAIGSTTPAGKYLMGKIGELTAEKDLETYQGRIIRVLGAGPVALHMTYPKERRERTRALETKTTEDNRKSMGCINISPENFDKYIKPHFEKGSQFIFITPDDPSMAINAENGKIEKVNQLNYASIINNHLQNKV